MVIYRSVCVCAPDDVSRWGVWGWDESGDERLGYSEEIVEMN